MNHRWLVIAALLVGAVSAQAERQVESIFGPRVGATYIATAPEEFDEAMTEAFGEMSRSYYPLITQFGLHFEQRVRLGDTDSHFVFQEVFLIGALDQNSFVPSGTVLIGYRSGAGLEFGLGPNLSMTRVDGEAKVGLSVAYAVGWTFSFDDVFVPINLAVVPTPRDGQPRFTFLTGFNFYSD
jgi:hypothetical protein